MDITRERFEKYCDTAMSEQIDDIFDKRYHTIMCGQTGGINDMRKAIIITMIINHFTKILARKLFEEE